MELIATFLQIILDKIADLEFCLFRNIYNRQQILRSLYLKLMKIEVGEKVRIGYKFYLRNKGNLTIGDRCSIGSFTRIWNYASISIGNDFSAAGGLTINSATHNPISLQPEGREIKIGDRVWCGVNVTIIAGVTIGNDVVIGAGAVVVKDIPNNSVVVGIPAKPIKQINRESVEMYSPFC